jgi:ribosomal protein S12 methylthiotransferase
VSRRRTVYLDSLGCEKNLVDSEAALGLLLGQGFEVVPRPQDADLMVVNTCGFLATARAESLERIRELAAGKNQRKLVVMGCLVQGGTHEVQRLIPEVDAVLGVGQYHRLASLWEGADPAAQEPSKDVLGGNGSDPELAPYMGLHTRARLTPPHVAYVKIAEGCNQACAFCKIPLLRGRQRSRPVGDVLAEARQLVEEGARELILIAQNSSAYGVDLPERPRLPQLCAELAALADLRWIRVMYAFPPMFTSTLARELFAIDKVASYLDIPIQHASMPVLERMRRGYDPDRLRRQVGLLRRLRPDVMLRTTALVGFPGETESDVVELLDFLADVQFDHVGTFTYSHESGTPSFALDDDVDALEKDERARRVVDLQWDVALERKSALVGKTLEIVVDEVHGDARRSGVLDLPVEAGTDPRRQWGGPVAFGRSQGFGYGIDGGCWLPARGVRAGDWLSVQVVACGPYDLMAEPTQESGR